MIRIKYATTSSSYIFFVFQFLWMIFPFCLNKNFIDFVQLVQLIKQAFLEAMGTQANTFNVIDYGAVGNGQVDDSIVCIF